MARHALCLHDQEMLWGGNPGTKACMTSKEDSASCFRCKVRLLICWSLVSKVGQIPVEISFQTESFSGFSRQSLKSPNNEDSIRSCKWPAQAWNPAGIVCLMTPSPLHSPLNLVCTLIWVTQSQLLPSGVIGQGDGVHGEWATQRRPAEHEPPPLWQMLPISSRASCCSGKPSDQQPLWAWASLGCLPLVSTLGQALTLPGHLAFAVAATSRSLPFATVSTCAGPGTAAP